MKKSLVIVLALVFVLGTVCTAFAAPNPFVDVPAKHWAYESVAKLAKAGIVDGYGDGTFRGDRTMTRYEMAVVVAKAMANQDRANAEQKAEIAKLEAEFSDELTKLGVRVSALENKVGNIKFSGQLRERYEWAKTPSNAGSPLEKTRVLIFMNAPLTEDLSFNGRYFAEGGSGGATAQNLLDMAYLEGKIFGGNGSFTLGRMGVTLGKGLLYNFNPGNDGVTLTVGNQVKFTAAAFKQDVGTYMGLARVGKPIDSVNAYAANIAWQATKNFDLTASYLKTKSQNLTNLDKAGFSDGDLMKSWSAGFGYNGIENIGLTFEYGKNSSDAAKAFNNGSDAKGWVAKAKYLGADNAKPKSWGFWVGYRNADPGFLSHTGDPLWETNTNLGVPLYNGSSIYPIYTLNNVKGLDYGFEYTLFKNGILTLQYQDLKDKATDSIDAKTFSAQLIVSF